MWNVSGFLTAFTSLLQDILINKFWSVVYSLWFTSLGPLHPTRLLVRNAVGS